MSIPMPDAMGYVSRKGSSQGRLAWTSAGGLADLPDDTALITEAQAEAYAAAVRREALEEAASIAAQKSVYLPHYNDLDRGYAQGREGAAQAIRALIEKEHL